MNFFKNVFFIDASTGKMLSLLTPRREKCFLYRRLDGKNVVFIDASTGKMFSVSMPRREECFLYRCLDGKNDIFIDASMGISTKNLLVLIVEVLAVATDGAELLPVAAHCLQ
jgi:hypothetical protein